MYVDTNVLQQGVSAGRVLGMMPAVLEARMALELNLLDSMEESLRQVNSIEMTRAVSLAQQETVALAQILKVTVHWKHKGSYTHTEGGGGG